MFSQNQFSKRIHVSFVVYCPNGTTTSSGKSQGVSQKFDYTGLPPFIINETFKEFAGAPLNMASFVIHSLLYTERCWQTIWDFCEHHIAHQLFFFSVVIRALWIITTIKNISCFECLAFVFRSCQFLWSCIAGSVILSW